MAVISGVERPLPGAHVTQHSAEAGAATFLQSLGHSVRARPDGLWCSRGSRFWQPVDFLRPREALAGPGTLGSHCPALPRPTCRSR